MINNKYIDFIIIRIYIAKLKRFGNIGIINKCN